MRYSGHINSHHRHALAFMYCNGQFATVHFIATVSPAPSLSGSLSCLRCLSHHLPLTCTLSPALGHNRTLTFSLSLSPTLTVTLPHPCPCPCLCPTISPSLPHPLACLLSLVPA